MSIESSMFATLGQYASLSALVGARIYPDAAPADVSKPYVVYQEISCTPATSLDGDSVSGGLDNAVVQVTSWAKTQDDARTVGRQVRAAMAAATLFSSVLQDYRSMPQESDTRLFSVQHDFSVWLRT